MSFIITPNNRLASHLRLAHARAQTTPVFESLTCLPYATFLENAWQNLSFLQDVPLLLQDAQALFLWRSLLAEEADLLLDVKAATQLVMKADHLCQEFLVMPEPSQFTIWAAKFSKLCQKKNYLAPTHLTAYITEHASLLKWPRTISLQGFLEFSPAQERLWQTLKNLGVIIHIVQTPPQTSASQLFAFQTIDEEIEVMANSLIQEALDHPHAELGCVVQHLETLRPKLLRAFQNSPVEVNISGGDPLSHLPLIHHALTFLSLRLRLDAENISLLLLSPYVKGASTESSARALQDYHFRSSTYPKTAEFATALGIEDFFQMLLPREASFSDWAIHFTRLLHALGWPGDTGLNSIEYQCAQKFQTCLETLARLDRVSKPVTFSAALTQLRWICDDTLFQPQDQNPRIHVLGMLESLGLTFDSLWIMNMDELTWPNSPNPNPYLPIELQKRLNFPRATSEREKIFAEKVTAWWQQSAKKIFFSYTEIQEGQILHPSILLKTLTVMRPPRLEKTSAFVAFENILEKNIPVTDISKIRGGSKIFKLQALCPFRAFSELRLNANQFPQASEGLTPQIRGQFLHKALELIWQELRTHHALCTHKNLSSFIKEKISAALNTLDVDHLAPAHLHLECERLQKILEIFLDLEKTRPPFTVQTLEKRQQVEFANLSLQLQIDRLDQLENGSHVLIDYKTGSVDIAAWWEERLSEPQLPLYAITQTVPLHALAFAELRSRATNFKGVHAEEQASPLPRLTKTDLAATRLQWKIHLTKLAEDFLAGVNTVDPKSLEQTCRTCHLSSLCRIRERAS